MNAGLLFVPVSVFQMMRGALPLWVGLFSILFLNRHLTREKWLSLGIITAGVALVGYAGSLQQQPVQAPAQEIEASTSLVSAQPGAKVVLGLFLIFFAQLLCVLTFFTLAFTKKNHTETPAWLN
jgi:drug/metabolite transporter (DMT)-like permease